MSLAEMLQRRLVPNAWVLVDDGDAYSRAPARASPTASASSATCCIRRPSMIRACP
jgi:hypothetical protein